MTNSWRLSFKNTNRRGVLETFLFMTLGILLAHQADITSWMAHYLDIPTDIIGWAVGFIFYCIRKFIMPTQPLSPNLS